MNVSPEVAALIPQLLLFFGTVVTVGGAILAAVIARRGRKDRAPVDDREDMTAQYEAMSIANRTVIETMKATNEANDRIIRTLTEDKGRLETRITELTTLLTAREADIAKLYETRDKHYEDYDRLTNEKRALQDLLDEAMAKRDNLQQELDEARRRIAAISPEALQDQIAKQRAVHKNPTGTTPVVEGGNEAS